MSTKSKLSRNQTFNIILYIFFFLMCACFVLPLIVVISASFTSEQALTSGGFSLLPRDLRSTRTSRHSPAARACCAPTA